MYEGLQSYPTRETMLVVHVHMYWFVMMMGLPEWG